MSFNDDPEDDEGPYEEDYDDAPVFVQEEPDCCSCNDSGGRCCNPTRLDILRWRIRSRLRQWTQGLHRRRPSSLDEPPF